MMSLKYKGRFYLSLKNKNTNMTKIKVIICILFKHKFIQVDDGGYCKRCGWFRFTNEFINIEHFSNLGLLKQK